MASSSHYSYGPTCSSNANINNQPHDEPRSQNLTLPLPIFSSYAHSVPSCSTDTIPKKRTIQMIPKRMTPNVWEDFEGIDQMTDESKRLYRSAIEWLYQSQGNIDKKELASQYLTDEQIQIFEYLSGSEENLSITKTTAPYYLRLVKLTDLALCYYNRCQPLNLKATFPHSTYKIRSNILKLLTPQITTVEAYTYTLDPKKMRNDDYLKDTRHWIPERIRFITQCILLPEYIRSKNLSNFLDEQYPEKQKPFVMAFMGNTACKKSRFAKENFANDLLMSLEGILDIDAMKVICKRKTLPELNLTNAQVHAEISKGPIKQYRTDMLNNHKFNIVVEGRFSLYNELQELFHAGKIRKGGVYLYDFDTPLINSLIGVLLYRTAQGYSACPPAEAIVQGFSEIRKTRLQLLIDLTSQNGPMYDGSVREYQLYRSVLPNGFDLAAHFVGEEEILGDIDLIVKCCKIYSQTKIENVLNTTLDKKLLQALKDKFERTFSSEGWSHRDRRLEGIFLHRLSRCANDYRNETLGKALDLNAIGIRLSKNTARSKFQTIMRGGDLVDRREPFVPTWLPDSIAEHILSEQLLHVRGADENGDGLLWPSHKFAWSLNTQFNPESKLKDSVRGGFQMRLGYFIIPPEHIEQYRSYIPIDPNITKDLEVYSEEGTCIGYRFFVHPEAFSHYMPLYKANIPYVHHTKSEYMATPTSSYRSLVIRRVEKENSILKGAPDSTPFIIKLGVGDSSNVTKLLSEAEIRRSIEMQNEFDSRGPQSRLYTFSEKLGFTLKGIPNYPPCNTASESDPINSGMIIREFPRPLLEGRCKIFSFSALMSPERVHAENAGLCKVKGLPESFDRLPLIYALIENAIRKKQVASSFEFINRYLVHDFIPILDEIFQLGLSMALHGQNLSIVLNNENIPIGTAIKDFGDIYKVKRFIEMYTWFYRYHIVTKLLNVITSYNDKYLPRPPGAPQQIGQPVPLHERNIHCYLQDKFQKEGKISAVIVQALKNLSITFNDYQQILLLLDNKYKTLLHRYFDLSLDNSLEREEYLPAAEVGSSAELALLQANNKLWSKHRSSSVNGPSVSTPNRLLQTNKERNGFKDSILFIPNLMSDAVSSITKLFK